MSYRLAPREETYNISELAYQLGVTVRRVHGWRGEGWIDPPSPRVGRGARYTDRHVRQGRALLAHLDRRLSLSDLAVICAEDGVTVADYLESQSRA